MKRGSQIILDLGRVKEIAEVHVNGKNMGNSWHAPFRLNITEGLTQGANELKVEVVRTINNALIRDARLPKEQQRMKTNIARLPNAWMNPFAEAKLTEDGLIGPVKIYFTGTKR